MMKKLAVINLLIVAALARKVAAQDPETLYGDWSEKGVFKWTDSSGEVVEWKDGSIAYINKQCNGNVGGGVFSAYGFVFAYDGCAGYWTDRAMRTVGAGGITFLSNGTYACGRNSFDWYLFKLASNQEWKGPSGEGAYANLSIGYPGYGNYWMMPAVVDPAVEKLDISGRLNVWLSSPSNDFSNVEISVASPARLYLPKAYPSKKLTLSGEGEMLPVGGTAVYFSSPSAILENLSVLDAEHVAKEIVLENGAGLFAASEAVFAVPTLKVCGGDSEIGGVLVVTQALTNVELSGGATLRLTSKLSERGVTASLTVSGSGTLVVDADNYGLSGALTLGENVDLQVSGKGKLTLPVRGGKSISVYSKDGGILYMPSSFIAAVGARSVAVEAGTVMLEQRSEDLSLTVKDGASVVYGEDNAYIVTDVPRSETSITLDGIRPLEIYGDGLTSNTKLTFVCGTNLVFRNSAVVASPIEISAADGQYVRCFSDSAVTATLSGMVKILQKKAYFTLSGPGSFELCGGFHLGAEGSFIINDDADVVLSGNKEYHVPGYGQVALAKDSLEATSWGRSLIVKDGAHLKMANAAKGGGGDKRIMFSFSPVNSGNYDNSSMLEVGEGGTVTFPDDGFVQIGGNQGIGKLIISGGTVNVGKNSHFCIGYGQYSTGYLYLNAGTLNLGSPFTIKESTDTSFVKLNGGTLAIAEDFTGKSFVEGVFSNGIEGSRRLAVEIAGDCTIDLTHSPYSVFTNMTDTVNRGEWYGKGSLKVKGGKTLLMRSMPDGVALLTEDDGSSIAIDDETRIFDYELCAANCIWRRPFPQANAEYQSDTAQKDELSLDSFAIVGGKGGFENRSEKYAVRIPDAFVKERGVWNNAFSLRGNGIALGNLTFAEGSTLSVNVASRVTPTLALAGKLTLPDGEMFLRTENGDEKTGEDATVFHAASGISGSPQWTKVSTRTGLGIDNGKLWLIFPGAFMILR